MTIFMSALFGGK